MQRVGAFNSSKGIPTSFIASQQQWDSDNAWPPMVHIVIEGFRTSEDTDLKHVARDLATAWLRANYRGYLETRAMFEKVTSYTRATAKHTHTIYTSGNVAQVSPTPLLFTLNHQLQLLFMLYGLFGYGNSPYYFLLSHNHIIHNNHTWVVRAIPSKQAKLSMSSVCS